jgi:hypothetical protein
MATETEDRLRLLLGEAYTEPQTEADTFFLDARITKLLADNSDNLNMAAAEGWAMKAAEYARLIDRDESGTNVKLSQKYRQAREMMNVFLKAAGEAFTVTSGAYRAIAKVASMDESCDSSAGTLNDYPFWLPGIADYPRVDAIKRFRP